MTSRYITVQEAATKAGKSTQTIRRLIKTSKIKFKKKRTPQGFNYMIDRESLAKYFGIVVEDKKESGKVDETFELNINPDLTRTKKKATAKEAKKIPVEEATVVGVQAEGITIETTFDIEEGEITSTKKTSSKKTEAVEGGTSDAIETEKFLAILQQMMKQHTEDKERLFNLVEQFQKRSVVLEERIKKLEAPKKRWWKLW